MVGGARRGTGATTPSPNPDDQPPRQVRDEAAMAAAALRVGVLLAVPMVAVAGLFRGLDGALTSLFGVALVVGGFFVTGRSLTWAAKRSEEALMAVALGGFVLRLALYAVLIVLLRPVEALDAPVLAISVAVALVVVLGYEVRLVLRHGELWWLHDRKERA